MIPLWKGKTPIYFGVIWTKVTIAINIIFDNGSFLHDKFSSCGSGNNSFYFLQIFSTMILCYAYIYIISDNGLSDYRTNGLSDYSYAPNKS
jgi:hypothetical protein